MLKDTRTWTTLVYFILMLPLGILYFVLAVVGLSVGIGCLGALPLPCGTLFTWSARGSSLLGLQRHPCSSSRASRGFSF